MDITEKYWKSYEMMEKSANDDKKIQITMLTFSITAASTIITLIYMSPLMASTSGENYNSELKLALPLIPMLFLIPCWVYYYDSAITIVRKISYCRVIERLLSGSENLKKFFGYECGIRCYSHLEEDFLRNMSDSTSLRQKIKKFFKILVGILFLRNNHKNWTIVFYTYCIASITCLIISFTQIVKYFGPCENNTKIPESLPQFIANIWNGGIHLYWAIGLFATIFFTLMTFRWLYQLNATKHSYDTKEKIWISVFKENQIDL